VIPSRSRRHSSAVEQLFRKQQVLSSNLSVGSILPLVKQPYPPDYARPWMQNGMQNAFGLRRPKAGLGLLSLGQSRVERVGGLAILQLGTAGVVARHRDGRMSSSTLPDIFGDAGVRE
jgi:hypothetical protein